MHPGLGTLVQRHRSSSWQKPEQSVDQPALKLLDNALGQHSGPVILDSFCGTGMSTAILGERYPDCLVIGVDQSAQRLGRNESIGENCLLLQAHCEAVWRHLTNRGQKLRQHYLLYPNPWPKASHLGRRVHGHPAFPLLPGLGGQLELRSNWQVYVEEFGTALHLLAYPARIQRLREEEPDMTRFEAKYRRSGHELWSLSVKFSAPAP
ncbi:unnamed protein product [Ectocarpus sp. 12 AP-2014]